MIRRESGRFVARVSLALAALLTACGSGSEDQGTSGPDSGVAADLGPAVDAEVRDPVADMAANTTFVEAVAAFQARLATLGESDRFCVSVVAGAVRPPAIAGSYHVEECSYFVSADGSHGHPCTANFTLAAQVPHDDLTDTIAWQNYGAAVPGAAGGYVRVDASGLVTIWFESTDAPAGLECTLSTINYVTLDLEGRFACGFSAGIQGSCTGIPSWWSWQGGVAVAQPDDA